MAKEPDKHEAAKSFKTTVEDAPDVEEPKVPLSDKTKDEMKAGKEAGQATEEMLKKAAAEDAKVAKQAEAEEKKADKE